MGGDTYIETGRAGKKNRSQPKLLFHMRTPRPEGRARAGVNHVPREERGEGGGGEVAARIFHCYPALN